MLEIIIKAVVTGFVLSIMIGPVFFILLETSMRRGIRAALAFDAGVLISDLLYILVAYLFFSEVAALTEGKNEGIIQVIGGILFLVFGLVTFFKKVKDQKRDDLGNTVNQSKDYIMLFIKGFLLNILNPMVIFYWFSVMAWGAKNNADSSSSSEYLLLIYIVVLLSVFFAFDILKIVGAKKLRNFVTDSVLRSLNRITGSILFGFGVVLIVRGIL